MASGDPIPLDQDARWWAMLQQAGGLASDAVEVVMHRAPPSTLGRGQRMGRYFRDVTTYRQHVSAQQVGLRGSAAWRCTGGV